MLYRMLNSIVLTSLKIVSIFHRELGNFLNKRLNQDLSGFNGQDTIWVHCSSMGEVNLSQPFVEKLLQEREERVLITVFTDTGYENAVSKYKDKERVKVLYFPLDNYRVIKKILRGINLKLLVIVETEIWPNLLKICRKSKTILINGRISDRSYPRYKNIKSFIKRSLNRIDNFFMQSQEDANRIISLGVDATKVEVVGNLKFAIEFPEYSESEMQELKETIKSEERKIIVLGSTRELEEEKILSNFKDFKNYLFVIVPRHLNRVENIEKLIKEKGLTYHKYSELETLKESVNIILVDAMGVQRVFYSIADVVFVGGTLVNIGGHSLLEPLFYGKSPIYGRYIQNVRDISKELLIRGLGHQIDDEREFQIEVESILKTDSQKEKINKLFEENKEVLKKILEKIEKLI